MDCVMLNGNVLTQTMPSRVHAIALSGGRIAAVGDDQSIRERMTANTELIDLRGRTVVPGFEDAHAHVWKMGHLLTSMVDLRSCESLDDIGDLLAGRRKDLRKGRWLQARGFNEAHLRERRRPTREDLDRWIPEHPVLMTRTCGHVFVASSRALQLAGITRHTPTPLGGVIEHDATGEPNGLLHETAVSLVHRVLPEPTRAEYEQMVLAALRQQASHGITSSSDCGVSSTLLEVYRDLDRRGALPGRMVVMPLGRTDGSRSSLRLPPVHRSEFLRIDTVKFLADGGLSGATAAISLPYRHSASTGVLRFADHDLRALFFEAQEAGWRIATHAIGDVAIEQVLSLYEELGAQAVRLRHRVEHFGMPSRRQLERAAALGIVSVTQAIFLRELGRNFLLSVPDALLPQVYPFRSMIEAGITMALSSDAPVVEDDSPLTGMHAAVTRKTREGEVLSPGQSISVEQALRAYTREGAVVAGEEQTRGTIEAGKVADLAVLSGDPLAVDPDALLTMRVEMTLVGGKVVYSTQN